MATTDPQYRAEDRQTIVCLYCGKPQEVARRAMTVTCRFCSKPLQLEDLIIKNYQARRAINTCGIVVIEKKGQIISDKILCGGMVVRGQVKGTIVSRGPMLVGPEAEVRGDVTAPTVAVGLGAVLSGFYKVGQKERVIEVHTPTPEANSSDANSTAGEGAEVASNSPETLAGPRAPTQPPTQPAQPPVAPPRPTLPPRSAYAPKPIPKPTPQPPLPPIPPRRP